MTAMDYVKKMTLEEKASLCSGLNMWYLKGSERLDLPSIMVTDGPHGLRKQDGKADHLGINESVPATCFPAACATACSFDRELLGEIGAAIAEECKQEDVAVLLGPGANIKRSPLCGRNFEYFSEDPFVTGEMAAAMIRGVQSKGVGTSLKHFALNNQETRRMTIDSVVDERAKREIYLTGFEKAVKNGKPWTVMCSYNKIDGIFASDNYRMMTEILRKEWGFDGIVVTDWGAMNDRVEATRAGVNLEMPYSGEDNDAKIVEAIRTGKLEESRLDELVAGIVELILRHERLAEKGYRYDSTKHHELARKAAAAGCVLLKNQDAILPLEPGKKVAVIGQFAKTPRYQGAGSSKIVPTKLDNPYDELVNQGVEVAYADGYRLDKYAKPDREMIEEACRIAEGKDLVLIFAGLPAEFESEGFDRTTMDMPDAHNQLIEEVCRVNNNVVVVLQLGAPVVMPWENSVKGILLAYLGGQAGGSGCVDVLLGKVSPGGRLAESWPKRLEDNPSFCYFPGGSKTVEYRESIFVGYRYYETMGIPVAWPFGHGLSYTTFAYSDLTVSADHFASGEKLHVQFKVKNTGVKAGSDVPQLYIGLIHSKILRAAKELKAFEKVFLEPGEERTVTCELDERSFAYYHSTEKCWAVEGGEYVISIGASVQDIRLTCHISVQGDGKETALNQEMTEVSKYFTVSDAGVQVSDEAFRTLLEREIPPAERNSGERFTSNSSVSDIQDTFVGKQLIKILKKQAGSVAGGPQNAEEMEELISAMISEMPLRCLAMMSGGAVSASQIEGIVDMANRNYLRGLKKMIKK